MPSSTAVPAASLCALYTFYYYRRSDMSGMLQTSFYFGYMAVVSYGFSVLLGSVGFFSSLVFVKKIYAAIKADQRQ